MNYLASIALIVSMTILSGCPEKSDTDTDTDTSETTESGTSGTTGTTEPGSTSPTADSDPSTTNETAPTSGDDPQESTTDATGTTEAPLDEDCAFLIGKNFVSEKQWPCGPPPDPDDPGPLCPDRLSFEQDTLMYQSGDFGVTGTYTCEGGMIDALTDDGESHKGTIDAATAALVWDDLAFNVE